MERTIISHEHPAYQNKRNSCGRGKYNGAYYYSREILQNIIPNVATDRNWITVNIPPFGCDHAIVFIHNNLRPQNYEWLKKYKDLVLVCGVKETCEKVAHLGKAIYLPLSIDTEYVKQFKLPKAQRTKKAAFVGRPKKRTSELMCSGLPEDIDIIEGIPRKEMLPLMAQYETIYAVGRSAIEAKVLGCKLKAYDPRYPKVSRWKVLDNLQAAAILQDELNKIDAPVIIDHNQEEYMIARNKIGVHKFNGAYYYSKEIVENIIPNVETDRSWITIKAGEKGASHSICFVHNNLNFEKTYEYMKRYDDVVYVVGVPDMVERASKFGKTIYLPLSVDVDYVKQFRTKKTKKVAFVGRPGVKERAIEQYGAKIPKDIDCIEGLPREELLKEMAKYKEVYAIGRTAVEARVLGCKVIQYHPRFQDPELWNVLDNSEAAQMLQVELNLIDKKVK